MGMDWIRYAPHSQRRKSDSEWPAAAAAAGAAVCVYLNTKLRGRQVSRYLLHLPY